MDEKQLSLQSAVRELSRPGVDPAGKICRLLSLAGTAVLAKRLGCSRLEVETAALESGIIPERYHRNIGTVGIAGQLALLRSHAFIAGAGGLGGLVIELLARMGVGRLTVIDDDSFCESNLNRQLLALEKDLGCGKAPAASRRVSEVNGSVELMARRCRGDSGSLAGMLGDCRVALDCLDNLPSRFALEQACQKHGIPLVHGAVAGFTGQVAVIWPGEPLFKLIYGSGSAHHGAEIHLGNPAPTPAMIASWQASEAVKILAGLPCTTRGRLLIIDMLSGETTPIQLIP